MPKHWFEKVEKGGPIKKPSCSLLLGSDIRKDYILKMMDLNHLETGSRILFITNREKYAKKVETELIGMKNSFKTKKISENFYDFNHIFLVTDRFEDESEFDDLDEWNDKSILPERF